ncbi:zinc knuckle CX2CX4HX4C containing protein [Tanacetum coccineum]
MANHGANPDVVELLRDFSQRMDSLAGQGASLSGTNTSNINASTHGVDATSNSYPGNETIPNVTGHVTHVETCTDCIQKHKQVIADLCGVSLNSCTDIEEFVKSIQEGTNEVWLELSSGVRDVLTDTVAKKQPTVCFNFRPLVVDPIFVGVNISIPRRVVQKVSTRFEHTLYGYFIGKRLAFPVVEYYARNNWGKHRLPIIIMNNKGFYFKFDSRAGLEALLEGGLWMIRKTLIILKKWSMGTNLLKEELTRIPIWVKLHDVPIQVFEEDGISLIAIFIGKPIMLDSYTSDMCKDSWGRSIFARCLIKVNSEANLVDVVTIGVPSLTRDDYTKETIRFWCSKKVVSHPIATTSNVVTPTIVKTNDGFQTVGKKKKKNIGKSKSTNGGQFAGPSVKQTVRYEPKAPTSTLKKGTNTLGSAANSSSELNNASMSPNTDNITSPNLFSALNIDDEEEEEDVENVYDETVNLFNLKTGGSSSFLVVAG